MTDFWKNKKVMVYIALTHHTRFLSPVMKKLTVRGAKIQYIVGQAERSQEITAIKLGLNYHHVYDYVTDKDNEAIHKNYLLLREAFTQNLKHNFLFGTSPVTVIDKTIYAAAVEYIGFKNCLKKERPDICFALHELNRWGKMFSFWSKKLNIPIITFQEGLYYGLNFGYTGHVKNSTLNLVWGERIKSKLTDFEAPGDKIIPVGNTHLSNEIIFQKKNNIREKKRKQYHCGNDLAILLLFSGEVPAIQKLDPLFDTIANTRNNRLFIKFHPITRKDQVESWTTSIPGGNSPKIKAFHDNENIYDLMSLSDVCVLVQASTTGLEALAMGKPLVQIDIEMKDNMPYSFTELKVATKMTPAEFSRAIIENRDFSTLTQKEDIKIFFKDELSKTKDAIDAVTRISEKIIRANHTPQLPSIQTIVQEDKEWSIILPISHHPTDLLEQLETIAVNSENQGTFEVILIEPVHPSQQICKILNSLKGEVIRLATKQGASLPEMMNKASKVATGKTLLLLSENLCPLPQWLFALKEGIERHGKKRLLGAKITDQRNSILHAGIVIDDNHTPVPAYKYVAGDFPNVAKERSFKMLDHFICVNRQFFQGLGGFWEKAGKFAFMDICLRTLNHKKGKEACIYIPDACMIALKEPGECFDPDASIHFYGRWHGSLWENQDELYDTDKITKAELDSARMAQSMQTAGIVG